MQEQLRRQYLQAMGIDVWERRVPAPVSLPVVPESAIPRATEPALEQPSRPASPEQTLVSAQMPSSVPSVSTESESLFSISASDFPDWLSERPLMLLRQGDAGSFVLGPSDAPLLLLSQCQVLDKLTHQPFGGAAGRLLNNMLAAIDRPACQHAELDSPHKDSDLLADQLRQRQIRLVVLMAEPANDDENHALTRLRGRVYSLPDGTQAMLSYHPAWLLANPADKALAWSDLRLLRSTLGAL